MTKEDSTRLLKNEERAYSVNQSIDVFQREKYSTPVEEKNLEEDLNDMICNILHNAQMNGLDPIKIVKAGIGAFSAENRSEDGEPEIGNDWVKIEIQPFEKSEKENTEKNLYHWNNVESLRRYANGEIVVIATSIEEAHAKAKEALIQKVKERNDMFFGDYADKDDWEDERQDLLKTVDNDMQKEPKITEVIAFLGSD